MSDFFASSANKWHKKLTFSPWDNMHLQTVHNDTRNILNSDLML